MTFHELGTQVVYLAAVAGAFGFIISLLRKASRLTDRLLEVADRLDEHLAQHEQRDHGQQGG